LLHANSVPSGDSPGGHATFSNSSANVQSQLGDLCRFRSIRWVDGGPFEETHLNVS
jgi:hypothetical protein